MANTKNLKGYKIDFVTNTLTMNHKFAAAAKVYNSDENKLMKEILADFPSLTIIEQSGRVQKTARPNTRLTYENMEQHIRAYDNAAELLNVFETVKALSVTCASPYKYVADWFKVQYPNYKRTPVFKDGKLTVLPIAAPDTKEYKLKMAKAG